jgi:hypothetical protein
MMTQDQMPAAGKPTREEYETAVCQREHAEEVAMGSMAPKYFARIRTERHMSAVTLRNIVPWETDDGQH